MADETNNEIKTETAPETAETTTAETQPATTEGLIKTEAAETAPETEAEKTVVAEPLTTESLTVPEGMTFEGEVADKFLGILNDTESAPADRANALLTLQNDQFHAFAEQAQTAWTDQRATWAEEVRADPVIGGEKLDKNMGEIEKLLNTYDRKNEVVGLLQQTNMDNNIEMVRLLLWAAKGLGEGGVVRGSPGATDKSRAEIMFGGS